MKRKFQWTLFILKCILLRFIPAVCCVSIALTPAFSQQRPNVLFIVIDDLRPALGCYGDAAATSPNIDRLAAKGTLFQSAYCQQAVCAPSRASFMTGKKPDNTKVWNLTTHFRKALPNVVTLPQYFKNNGYYARQIGKIYHDPKDAQDPRSWSAPELLGVTTNLGKYVLDSNLARAPKANVAEAAEVADSAYIDGMVANEAVRELRSVKNKAFFLAVGFRRPHLPFSVPLTYWKRNAGKTFSNTQDTAAAINVPKFSVHNSVELRGYQDIPDFEPINKELSAELVKGYYTAVSFTDEQVGKVLAELKQLQLEKNTIVVILSDHGFHLGEHGMWGKTTNSKIDTRVPLIIYDPTQTKSPKLSKTVVQLVDLYATLADLCGLPTPSTDGLSFANILKQKPYTGTGMAFSQFPDDMKFDKQPRVMGYAVHTNRFGYVEWMDTQTGKILAQELYDYKTDAGENRNVSADKQYTKQVSQFHQQISFYKN